MINSSVQLRLSIWTFSYPPTPVVEELFEMIIWNCGVELKQIWRWLGLSIMLRQDECSVTLGVPKLNFWFENFPIYISNDFLASWKKNKCIWTVKKARATHENLRSVEGLSPSVYLILKGTHLEVLKSTDLVHFCGMKIFQQTGGPHPQVCIKIWELQIKREEGVLNSLKNTGLSVLAHRTQLSVGFIILL